MPLIVDDLKQIGKVRLCGSPAVRRASVFLCQNTRRVFFGSGEEFVAYWSADTACLPYEDEQGATLICDGRRDFVVPMRYDDMVKMRKHIMKRFPRPA